MGMTRTWAERERAKEFRTKVRSGWGEAILVLLAMALLALRFVPK